MDLLPISTACTLLESIILLNLMHKELIVCSEIVLGYEPKHSEWDQPGDLLQNCAADPNEHTDAGGHAIYPLSCFWEDCTWESEPCLCLCIHQSVLLEALGSLAKHPCFPQLNCRETRDLTKRNSIPGNPNQDLPDLGCSFQYQINMKEVRKEDRNKST